jgi:aspartyl-tRNA(Asn)/glutamyl-tRNA(Gln) amidotransferase subunit C
MRAARASSVLRSPRNMPAPIDRAQIEHVAKLASLSLTDDEAAKMTAEIGAILTYVEELASLDTSNVEPDFPGRSTMVALAAGGDAGAAWRPDVVEPGLPHDVALAQAPRAAEGGFAVKAFVEGG